jgi:hypothetical protein
LLLNRDFRRNGYASQPKLSHLTYDEICQWCITQFGERFGCRYHFWDELGEWQFYRRADHTLFMLTWGGSSEKTG